MTNLTATSRCHIETLIKHGAYLCDAEGRREPLTNAFCEQGVAACERCGCNAITYRFFLPGIEIPMAMAIWRDGHVDTGSEECVTQVLDRQNNP